MSHIFISYSRRDIDFAQKIVDALATNNLDTWIDWKSIPKGEKWLDEIYLGIEGADAFLFLISPDSAKSEYCNKEIDHAVKNGKRILPIVIRDTDAKIIHPEITKRNWIFCRDGQDDFNKAIEETRKTIHIDYEWLKFHTELQIKALKWEKKKDNSRLLRGKELREADDQLAQAGEQNDPQPTDIQRLFILTSRRNEERQRKQFTFGLVAGSLILLGIAIVATLQWVRAETQASIALSRQLAAQSNDVTLNPPLPLLLSLQALKIADTIEGRDSLFRKIPSDQLVKAVLSAHSGYIYSIDLSPNGKILATSSDDGTIKLWDLSDPNFPTIIGNPLKGHSDRVISLDFSPDGNVLASGSADKLVILWDISNPKSPNVLSKIEGHKGSVLCLDFSPNGKVLASGDGSSSPPNNGFYILWDVSNPKEPKIIGTPVTVGMWWVNDLSFSFDGKILSVGSSAAQLWDVSNPEYPKLLTHEFKNEHGTSVYVSQMSPNARTLAVAHSDGLMYLWDISDLTNIYPYGAFVTGHTEGITEIVFSPNGTLLASASQDRSVRIYDVEDPKSPRNIGNALTFRDSVMTSVIFSPNNKILVSGTDDGEIVIWNMDLESWKLIGCNLVERNFTQDEWRQYIGNISYQATCSIAYHHK